MQDVAYLTERNVSEIYQCYCLYQFIIFIVGCSTVEVPVCLSVLLLRDI